MIALPVSDPSQVSDARRRAADLAAHLGFDEVRAGRVSLIATELGTNLVKHATGGRLLVGTSRGGIDLLSLDSGPGIANLQACLADGYSTAGTAGNGLGAVRRLAGAFAAASWPGIGTAVLARVDGAGAADPGTPAQRLGAVVVPRTGEEACGDAWSSHEDADGMTLFVVDGLGHGTEAAMAAHEALRLFQRHRQAPPAAIVDALHHGLKATRGGAVAVARIDWASASVNFAGLGNIAAMAIGRDGSTRRMVSHNGTAGHNARKIQAFDYPITDGMLVMHSDGLSTHWQPSRYAGLLDAEPLLAAGVLYQQHQRGNDDSLVLVASTVAP